MLDKLKKMTGGDEQRMTMYINTYTDGITEYIALLSEAISNNNIPDIRTATHTSKPLFTIMGFQELWNLANVIEQSIDLQKELELVLERSKHFLSDMEKSLVDLQTL